MLLLLLLHLLYCRSDRKSIRMSERVIQRKLRLYTTPRFLWVTRYNKSCHSVPRASGVEDTTVAAAAAGVDILGNTWGLEQCVVVRTASRWTRKSRLAKIGSDRVIGTIGWEVCVLGIRGNKMVSHGRGIVNCSREVR